MVQQPLELPRRPQKRRSFPWVKWTAAVILLALVPIAAYYSYQMGRRFQPLDIWDPLWLRAYQDRPMDTSLPGTGFWVTGYYVDYDRSSLEMVKRSAGHMDQVIVFGYGFDRQGNPLGREQDLVRGLTGPQKRVLLFGNLTDGKFDRETARAILNDMAVQNRAVQAIIAKSDALGAASVQIDFEDLAPEDRDAYTAFLRRLKGELQARNMTLSIAAAAKTKDTRTGWGGATDYVAIGQIVDQFYIMTYDEHWRGGPPGPVASLAWTEKVIRYATGVMPAQKIVLGIPFYGYEWAAGPEHGTRTNRAYGYAAMARRVQELGAKVTWDPVMGENVATFKSELGERIAWYPDERSVEAKLKLAYQYNLKGISIWRLGFEPDQWWHRLGAFRLAPTK